MTTAICELCGYLWKPRVVIPKACPMCKQYKHITISEVKEECLVVERKEESNTLI